MIILKKMVKVLMAENSTPLGRDRTLNLGLKRRLFSE